MYLFEIPTTRAAIIDRDHCHFPVSNDELVQDTGEMRLAGTGQSLRFARVCEAPFEADYRSRWDLSCRLPVDSVAEDAAMLRATWLADRVVAEWRRSVEHGIPYSTQGELTCPVEPFRMPQPPPDLVSRIRPPGLPVLVWFGWVYDLAPAGWGPVRLYDRYYDLGPAQKAEAWLGSFGRRADDAVREAAQRQSLGDRATHQQLQERMEELRGDPRSSGTVVLLDDRRFQVTYLRDGKSYRFSMPYKAYCLESGAGTLYHFGDGRLEVCAGAQLLSAFISSPGENFPRATIRSSTSGLSPFENETDHSLCDAGHAAVNLGSALSCNLAPPGRLLRSLVDGINILRTGGGNVSHTPYRPLEDTRAPTISRQNAEARKLPIMHWNHSERGKEVIPLG